MFESNSINTKVAYIYFFAVSTLLLIYYNYGNTVNIAAINSLTPRPLILLWHKINYWKPKELNELDCEFKCKFTYDRKLISVSKGVMFYWRSTKSNSLPNYHFADQHWIIVHDEAPTYTSKLPEVFKREVNWLVTFRLDSSIPAVYGQIIKRDIAVPYKLRTHFSSKNRNVAWFVSHCKTKSRREIFANQLSNYIDVDIYGHCGNLTCGGPTYIKRDDTSCYRMVENKYKFYFSSENSLCNDYITEKVFFLLDFEIIPVVYGGANYSAILPPNSYIDARNFSKINELADFLRKVGSDEQLYHSYFEWKSDYKVLHSGSWKEEKLPNRICEICKGLYNPSTIKDYRGTDINEWWFSGQCE